MKKNCNKIKHTCGSIVFADCTSYQTDLPEFSELECPSIEETTEELYNLVGEIKEQTDDLGSGIFSNHGIINITADNFRIGDKITSFDSDEKIKLGYGIWTSVTDINIKVENDLKEDDNRSDANFKVLHQLIYWKVITVDEAQALIDNKKIVFDNEIQLGE